jgi:nucleoid-associated protein YgaU
MAGLNKLSNRDNVNNLTILVELPGTKMQFDEKNPDCCIVAMFNPNRLTISRNAQWASQKAAKRDSPELQFTSADPATLSLDLFFDTYDSPSTDKQKVTDHTVRLLKLTTVESHGDKHRPPVCRLKWNTVFFQGVLQQLEQHFTLFMADGTPVRATAKCTFRQWESNLRDLNKQDLLSSDVVKTWVVRQGQTLADIAAHEYGDPRKWRPIADANNIADPLRLAAGATLVLPALRPVAS